MLVAQGLSLLVYGVCGSLELDHCGSEVCVADGLDICEVMQIGEAVNLSALVKSRIPEQNMRMKNPRGG